MIRRVPFVFEVFIDLSIERDRPCRKVDPSDNLYEKMVFWSYTITHIIYEFIDNDKSY